MAWGKRWSAVQQSPSRWSALFGHERGLDSPIFTARLFETALKRQLGRTQRSDSRQLEWGNGEATAEVTARGPAKQIDGGSARARRSSSAQRDIGQPMQGGGGQRQSSERGESRTRQDRTEGRTGQRAGQDRAESL